MTRHEERSSAGLVIAVVLLLVLCIAGAAGGGTWWYWRQQQLARIQFMQAEYDLQIATISAQQVAASQQILAPAVANAFDLEVDAQGKYFVDGRELTADELTAALQAKAGGDPAALSVNVNASDIAPASAVMAATKICDDLGIQNVSLRAAKKD